MYTIHGILEYIVFNDQTNVKRTRIISIDARTLLFKPNCIGVKAKLNIRFSTNGSATLIDNVFLAIR